jgi:transposase
MKQLAISDSQEVIMALQDEIRRSKDARYHHRLHAILLVAQGMSCPEVARLLGDAPRAVQMWVHQFEDKGFSGLVDKSRPGRPPRLTDEQLAEISDVLHSSPEDHGLGGNLWDGKTLSSFIFTKYGIKLGVRQCQRLFRQLGFRYRKPRPLIAGTDPTLKEAYKKNSRDDAGP